MNAPDVALLPRLVRLRDAPHYLGMDRNRFNAEVRPKLKEVPIGKQGVAFDRLELDRWADEIYSPQRASRSFTWRSDDMGRKRTPGLYLRGGVWHIDKLVRGRRVCESTGESDLKKAEEHLARRIEEARQASVFGVRPRRSFRAAATRYLGENQDKRSIGDEALHLRQLEKLIGDMDITSVHMGTLQPFIEARLKEGVKTKTVNLALGVVRHILNVAASEWIDEHGLTWLASAPKIKLLKTSDGRKPYPLSLDEQERLFAELPEHLHRMALFKVNTGCRDAEVCGLRREWELEVPELETSVFMIPGEHVKNGSERLVVLNSVARSIIEQQRGVHPEFVFVYSQIRKEGRKPVYRPIETMNNTSWQKARARAELPQVRVHDLKHTFGRRLRAAGVSFEDRQDLLGHKSERMTTHYSAAELSNLIKAAEKACEAGSRKSPAVVALKQKAAGDAISNRLMLTANSGAPGRI